MLSRNNGHNIFIPQLVKYKIVFLGNQAVGKSSIINRFIYDMFQINEQHHPTIGIDFISHNIVVNDKPIRLQIWDTAGQQRFRSLIPSYIRDSAIIIIVYDVTNRKSFESVKRWIDDARDQRGDTVIIGVIGNKIDLQNRQTSQDEGKQFSEQNKVMFCQVSAKSGYNIQQFFKLITSLLPDPDNHEKGIKQKQYSQMIKESSSKILTLKKVHVQEKKSRIGLKRKCC